MNLLLVISVSAGVLTYVGMFLFALVNWRRGVTGRALMLAVSVTLLWMSSPLFAFSRDAYFLMETAAVGSWLFLLIRALGYTKASVQSLDLRPITWIMGAAILAVVIAFGAQLLTLSNVSAPSLRWITTLSMVVLNVVGLVLIEQVAGNVIGEYRWRIRYLNLGLGMTFAFGLVHHALTILLGGPALTLAVIQPAIMALLVPFVVIASLRNPTNMLRFSLSREFVFRTGILVGAGIFLILLALFGYLAQIFAGQVGITIAVFFAIVAIVTVWVLVGSSRVRSRIRIALVKSFFEYRYEYRDEWIKVTSQLTEPDADFDLPQQAQRAMLSILSAQRCALWIKTNEQTFEPLSHIEASTWMVPLTAEVAEAIGAFYDDCNWVLDFANLPASAAEIRQGLSNLAELDEAAYMVPLFVENRLFGVCIIGPSELGLRLSWEDYDILKLISTQGAGFLALQEAHKTLLEKEQLSAVHQMSAFLLHDIKTIAAQLSLLLQNAPKHRENPAFIDDMLKTTRNSVARMERIIAGLRQPHLTSVPTSQVFDAVTWLKQRQANTAAMERPVSYSFNVDSLMIKGDEDALETALTHLEQNALEAIEEDPQVVVRISSKNDHAAIEVIDNGKGMEEAFIRNELFTPFRSTKGLTGMGIGAYQARDKIRKSGGDLQVTSKIGLGTTFTIKLPLAP